MRWCHGGLQTSRHRPARLKPSNGCVASPPPSTSCGRCRPMSEAPCRPGVSALGPSGAGSRLAQRPPGANGCGLVIPGGSGS